LAARLTRIVLPAQIFFYIGGLLMAVQYARKQFFLPALAPLIYNAGIIAGGLLLGRDHGMEGFAWGVLAGSFVGNFALQIHGARRGGLSFSPRLDFSDPGLKEFIRLSIPIMLGFSLVVVDEWTTRVFGSFLLAGAITWLNNARRLMLVPVGIFGQASGVASYPFLSSLAAEGKKEEMWNTLSVTLRWVFLVSAGVAAIAVVLSREAVLLVYQRGAFTIDDTMRTASALSAFCLGIPFWCAQSIVSRGFFAMRDTWTPTIVGTAAGIVALPLILLYAGALYGILMRRTVGRRGVPELIEYGKMALAAALAGTAGYFLLGAASRFLAWETVFGSMIRLAGGAAAIGGIYFLLAFFLHSGTARTIHRREDLLHPPGSIPDGEGGGNGITPS
jgi:putative peptidoglycan lipid II flippase